MSYPDFPVIDRRDYRALINVVRAAQKKKDYELAAFALAVMVHATPWRVSEKNRKVDLLLVWPNTVTTRINFLFVHREKFSNEGADVYSWVLFPAYPFTGEIAAGLTFEAGRGVSPLVPVVTTETLEAFKEGHARGRIPGDLYSRAGCLEVIKCNMGSSTTPRIFSDILGEGTAAQCLAQFTKPHQPEFLF